MAYKTGNPALSSNAFNNLEVAEGGKTMTLEGTANKSLLMLLLCVASGAAGWRAMAFGYEWALFAMIGVTVIAFILALITIFKKTASPITAPLYAVFEGFALGAISYYYEQQFGGGIVLQAVLLTVGILFTMLVIYRLRIIKVTENLKLGIFAATGGIALYYLAFLLLGLFGIELPLINSNSPLGIVFSVVVIIVAAFNLVLDFDFIESGVEKQVPKYMEWYASFGLFVTIVWLYLEILRLLGKSRS